MTIEELYQCFLQCDEVCTDTRKIKSNSLFFALKGENFDANNMVEEALNKGASFVVMDNKKLVTNEGKMFWFSDALMTLQELAKFHRQQLGLPIIAISGTNGKTTTKELINCVLSKKYNTKATVGNLNNHIGVPLTILSFNEDTDIGIVEMGANHLGEISRLCDITDPDFGYITNFGKAHLKGFGSLEGVIKAKSELYDYLENNNKLAFTNTDDTIQDTKTMTFTRYCFGIEKDNDFIVKEYLAQPMATVITEKNKYESNLTGIYNATNIAAALAIGKYFEVNTEDCKEAISSYIPSNNRSQWIEKNNHHILLDAYNANPSSMEAALNNFIQLKSTKPKVLFLGDMFELGTESSKEHLNIIKILEKINNIQVYFIGEHYIQHELKQSNIFFFKNFEDLANYISKNPLSKDKQILIKGSRGMALERILDII